MSLTLTRISAENILKYEQFSLDEPKKLTLFRGPNDVGKTTALKLLSLAVTGASDPRSIIHDGADKGEIVLDFVGFKLRRSFTEKGTYLKITDADGRTLPSPQQWLNDRIGEFRDFNPLAWLSLANSDTPEDRRRAVAILLRAIDVRLTRAEFIAATGLEPPSEVSFDEHGLVVLEALREHFADERKSENKTADQKRKAAAEARAQLPSETPVITDSRRAEAQAAVNEAKSARAAIESRQLAAKEHGSAVDRIGAARKREDEERTRLQSEIDECEREIARLNDKIARRREQQRESIAREQALELELEGLAASAPPSAVEIENANALVRRANELTKAISDDEKVIARFAAVAATEEDANSAAARAAVIDGIISTIAGDLRAQLLAKAQLPVGALAVNGDRIFVDGHDLQHIAESRQIRVALAIARSLNPKLRVIVLDGSERLDAKTFELFLEEIRSDGFSYFAAEVDRNGQALEIISFGEDGAASPAVAEVA